MQEAVQLWQDQRGEARIQRLADRVVCLRLSGNLDRAAAQALETGLQKELTRGRIHLFCDFWELVTYDSQIRVRCTAVILRNRAACESLHAVTRSKLVAMGISVASLALGGFIQVYDDRTSFEATLRHTLNGQLPR